MGAIKFTTQMYVTGCKKQLMKAKRKILSVQEGDSVLTVQTRACQKRDELVIIALRRKYTAGNK